MSVVKDIADFIALAGLGTVGSDIFCADMPDTPDSLVCLYEYAGNQPLLNETLDQPALQVRVRGTVYETARTLLQSIQNLLMKVGNTDDATYFDGVTINGKDYLRIVPAQGITPLGRDSKERFDLVQNFYIVKRR
jgi:hypothetical protein